MVREFGEDATRENGEAREEKPAALRVLRFHLQLQPRVLRSTVDFLSRLSFLLRCKDMCLLFDPMLFADGPFGELLKSGEDATRENGKAREEKPAALRALRFQLRLQPGSTSFDG